MAETVTETLAETAKVVIGAVRETAEGERRVALTPETCKKLVAAGARVRIETPRTIADGAQTQQLGELGFPIIQRAVADILTVTDDELLDATRSLGALLDCPVEPTGCLGYAGAQTELLRGQRVGVIVSGGNADAIAAERPRQ